MWAGLAATVPSSLSLRPPHRLSSSRLPCPLSDSPQRPFLRPRLPLKMPLKWSQTMSPLCRSPPAAPCPLRMRRRLLLQTSRACKVLCPLFPPQWASAAFPFPRPPALGPTSPPSLPQRSQAKGPPPWLRALVLPTGPRRASQTPSPPQPLLTGPFPGQSPSLRVLTDVTSHLLFSMCICLSVSPTRVEAPCWLGLVHTRHPQCPVGRGTQAGPLLSPSWP